LTSPSSFTTTYDHVHDHVDADDRVAHTALAA
jgi:hypothetical protein